jgi:hypothetical protein
MVEVGANWLLMTKTGPLWSEKQWPWSRRGSLQVFRISAHMTIFERQGKGDLKLEQMEKAQYASRPSAGKDRVEDTLWTVTEPLAHSAQPFGFC